jgi:hypothetical protein
MMKSGLLGLSMLASVSQAQVPPDHFETKTVPFYLVCATPTQMRDVLLEEHGEIAMIAGWLDTGNQWLLYTNEGGTSMSFVVHKSDGEACIIWSGNSKEGTAFIPNPEPMFPDQTVTNKEEWNL